MKLKFLLFLIIALFTLQAKSQKKWSLEDCINYALDNNLQVKRTKLQANISGNNYVQARINLAPNLNASFDRNYSYGRGLDPQSNEYTTQNYYGDDYYISSDLTLFNGLQGYNNIKKNEYAMLAAVQNVERQKVELTLNIAKAYLDILFKKELLEVNKNQMEIASKQAERTKKLVEAGSSAKGDYLEMQSQLASEKLNVTNAKNDLNVAYLNLTQLLDLDSTGGFEIVVPDTIDPNINLDLTPTAEIYQQAISNLPYIKQSEYELKSQEYNLFVQKGLRSPKITLNSNWTTRFSTSLLDNKGLTYSDQFNLPNTVVGISVSIPIFNRWQVNNAISNAKIQVSDAQYSLDQTKQQLYKEIQQSHNDAVAARARFYSATEAVNSYKESFHYTEQKYNVGLVNSVEYSIAKNNYIKAESELLRAKYQYIFSVKILDFYKGKSLTL